MTLSVCAGERRTVSVDQDGNVNRLSDGRAAYITIFRELYATGAPTCKCVSAVPLRIVKGNVDGQPDAGDHTKSVACV